MQEYLYTFILLLAPAAVLSGTATLIEPELKVAVPGTGGADEPAVNNVPLVPATPPQTGPGGVTGIIGNAFTVNMAPLEIAAGVHIPLITQR